MSTEIRFDPNPGGAVIRLPSSDVTIPVSGRTWAAINATTPAAGTIAYSTDIGVGTHMSYVGGRWKPVGGRAILKALGAPVTGITNPGSAPIIIQTLLPAGAWRVNDVIRIHLDMTKSGTTDNGSGFVYIGTVGTVADTAVINGSTYLAASALTWAGVQEFKLLSATSVQKVGGSNTASTGIGTTGAAAPAAVVIPSAAANALWISFAWKSSGASNTVGVDSAFIELVTP